MWESHKDSPAFTAVARLLSSDERAAEFMRKDATSAINTRNKTKTANMVTLNKVNQTQRSDVQWLLDMYVQ